MLETGIVLTRVVQEVRGNNATRGANVLPQYKQYKADDLNCFVYITSYYCARVNRDTAACKT